MSDELKVEDLVTMPCSRQDCRHSAHTGPVRSIRTTGSGVTLVLFVDAENCIHQAPLHMIERAR